MYRCGYPGHFHVLVTVVLICAAVVAHKTFFSAGDATLRITLKWPQLHSKIHNSTLQSLAATWRFGGVQQCLVEGDKNLCLWCNSTFTSLYPFIEAEHFQRSYVPGDPCSMPSGVLHKLESGQPITINVVGGSMTAGHGCFNGPRTGRACAWPSHLQERLQAVYPKANISVVNMARPGYSYTDVLSSGLVSSLVNADLLIIDQQVNSQAYNDTYVEMEALDEVLHRVLSLAKLHQHHLGIMFVESFRACSLKQYDCNIHCPQERQGYLLYNFTGNITKYTYCNRWWTIASFERPVVAHYQLPIASYRDAVWPDLSKPGPLLPCFWNGLSHPDAIGHAMMADVVTYGLLRSLGAINNAPEHRTRYKSSGNPGVDCSIRYHPVKFHQQLPTSQFCSADHSGTFLSIEQPLQFKPLAAGGCWKYFEDIAGKPGWICSAGHLDGFHHKVGQEPPPQQPNTTYHENTLVFNVSFSTSRQLQLTYLTSYENMGVAEVALHAGNTTIPQVAHDAHPLAKFTINSAIKERFSIPRTSIFVHPANWQHWKHDPNAQQLPACVQQGGYLLSVRPVGPQLKGKFKVIAVASC